MAIGTPTGVGSTNVTNTGGSCTATAGANVAVGDLVVMVGTHASNRTASSASDSDGVNTYTERVDNGLASPPGGNPCWVAVYDTLVSDQIETSDVITITLSSSFFSERQGMALKCSGLAGTLEASGTASDNAFPTSSPHTASTGPTCTTTTADCLLVGVMKTAQGRTFTANDGWTEIYDAGGACLMAKVVSSAGSQGFHPQLSSADYWYGAILAYPIASAGGPWNIDIAQATETDSAFAMGRAKARGVGLVSETETVFAITARKTRSLAIVSETDSVFALGTTRKTKAIGLASETDAPLAITARKAVGIGLVSETDSAFAVARKKAVGLGLAAETDALFAPSRLKRVTLALLQETDLALPLDTGAAEHLIDISLATETDSTFPVTARKARTLGLVSDTSTTFASAHAKRRSLAIVTETDTPLAPAAAKRKSIGLATETDAALAITRAKRRSLAIVSDTSGTFSVGRRKQIILGLAAEVDQALELVNAGAIVTGRFDASGPSAAAYASSPAGGISTSAPNAAAFDPPDPD